MRKEKEEILKEIRTKCSCLLEKGRHSEYFMMTDVSREVADWIRKKLEEDKFYISVIVKACPKKIMDVIVEF